MRTKRPNSTQRRSHRVYENVDTLVYLEALKRVQGLANQQALDVYVASDNAESLMKEIKENHAVLWEEMNWHFLEHGRDVFK